MNLNQLQEFRPRHDELRVIGRGVAEGEAASELVGMTRKGGSVRLYALQFDGEAREARLLAEEEALSRPPRRRKQTRRREQFGAPQIDPHVPFYWLDSIQIGGRTHAVCGGSSGPVENNWSKILLLEEFLRRGYQPRGELACRNFEDLTLTEYQLRGEYRRIPLKKEGAPLSVTTSPEAREHRCRKRMRLEVGRPYPRPHILTDERTGKPHRIYIESLSLTDVWAEAEERFRDPRFLEQMTPAQFEELKQRHFAALSRLCPRGMLLPAVEYEAGEGISLEFYQTEWLDAPPDPPCEGGSTGMVVMMKPDRGTGRHGLPLKAAAVHSPVSPGTAALNLEILRWHEQTEKRTLSL